MDPVSIIDPDQAAQSARLRQLLRFIVGVSILMALAELGLGVALASPILLLLGMAALLMLAAALGALALVGRGALRPAVFLLTGAGLSLTMITTALMPAMMPGMIVVPLVMVILLLPYISPRTIGPLVAASVASTLALYLIGALLPPFFAQPPRGAMVLITASTAVAASGIAILLLWQFSGRLIASLRATQAANAALQEAQSGLEHEVAARTADLRAALGEVERRAAAQAALLDENSQQREVIREMSVPVLPVSATTLVMPLIGALDSARLQDAQAQALASVEQSRARRLILDITGVPVVDTQVAQGLVQTVRSIRLLGAEAILVGVRPEVAQTIVGLGLTLESIRTAADVQSALR